MTQADTKAAFEAALTEWSECVGEHSPAREALWHAVARAADAMHALPVSPPVAPEHPAVAALRYLLDNGHISETAPRVVFEMVRGVLDVG